MRWIDNTLLQLDGSEESGFQARFSVHPWPAFCVMYCSETPHLFFVGLGFT
jgi:hypothetical protein